jgi:hypothetical protein
MAWAMCLNPFLISNNTLSGVDTGEKTLHVCRFRKRWRFGERKISIEILSPGNLMLTCEKALKVDSQTSGLYYKTFRIVIYDRNDSTNVETVV